MGCTCGSAGALDGHSPFCDLRKVESWDAAPPRLNKVVVGLPERLEKRDDALRELEGKLAGIKLALANRGLGDRKVLDAIERIVND